PDLRLEGEAATIAAQEILGVLEILRAILLPDDEAAVLVCQVRLHRREGRAGREPRLFLRRQRRQAGQFREAREIALAHREVPAGWSTCRSRRARFNGGSGYSRAKCSSSGVQMPFPYRTRPIGKSPWSIAYRWEKRRSTLYSRWSTYPPFESRMCAISRMSR